MLRVIDRNFLLKTPLPQPQAGDDKEGRGRVLVIGGARQMPGPIILSSTAALRAGAGKLQIATVSSVAANVATAVPEALVHGLAEARDGSFAAAAMTALLKACAISQAILMGPGMLENATMHRLVCAVLRGLRAGQVLVLDAGALAVYADGRWPKTRRPPRPAGAVILTPHAGEMAMMLGRDKNAVSAAPYATAVTVGRQFGVIAVLKGRETFVSDGKTTVVNRAGNVGLATSGSGDVLGGIIAGLAARGAQPQQAAAFGVHLHARAGEVLARKVGPLGYLARELMAEIPALMADLAAARRSTRRDS
jgi:ADP-dependent NAD(P)H-hydrate dehydratase